MVLELIPIRSHVNRVCIYSDDLESTAGDVATHVKENILNNNDQFGDTEPVLKTKQWEQRTKKI